MVINKYSLGILFVLLTLGSLFLNGNIVNDTSSSLNKGSYFDQWRPSTQDLQNAGCSCHQNLNTAVGSGTLDINNSISVDAYSEFALQAKVTGFTQADSDTIVIGFNSLDSNNSLFSVTSSGGTDYIASINVDGSGSSSYVTFNFTAPSAPGTYVLTPYAVHATTSQEFYYLSANVTVQVKQSTINLPNSDIITYKVNHAIVVSDGKIDPIWSNVPETQISEFGSGGFIKSVQDGTYLYSLLAYDPSMTWIGVEFNVSKTNPVFMESGTNGWIFGTGSNGNFYGDYNFVGEAAPQQNTQDVVFYNVITQGSLNYIQTARLLETSDTSNNDFEFNVSETFTAVFASNIYHTSSHKVLTWTITDIAPPGAGNVAPLGKISPPINLQQISDVVFVISVVIVIVTVFIHISLRVVSKPITHERRIVYSNKIPNHPGSIPLIKKFLGEQKRKIFKPKPKTVKKE